MTVHYNINPRPGVGDVKYNVICQGCRPGTTGPITQFSYTTTYCIGDIYGNGIYEMEIATDYGKAYSPVYIETESNSLDLDFKTYVLYLTKYVLTSI